MSQTNRQRHECSSFSHAGAVSAPRRPSLRWRKERCGAQNPIHSPAKRRLSLGIAGSGKGTLVGQWHATGAWPSDQWELGAGSLPHDPDNVRISRRDCRIDKDRTYTDYHKMAKEEAARRDRIEAGAICARLPLASIAGEQAGLDIVGLNISAAFHVYGATGGLDDIAFLMFNRRNGVAALWLNRRSMAGQTIGCGLRGRRSSRRRKYSGFAPRLLQTSLQGAEKFLAVAPKVRTKSAADVVQKLLKEDAASASITGSTLSR